MLAGLDFAKGQCDAVILMDSDLQHPPALIPEMVAAFEAGAEIVTAIRKNRQGESGLKIATSRWFYSLFNSLVAAVVVVVEEEVAAMVTVVAALGAVAMGVAAVAAVRCSTSVPT